MREKNGALQKGYCGDRTRLVRVVLLAKVSFVNEDNFLLRSLKVLLLAAMYFSVSRMVPIIRHFFL